MAAENCRCESFMKTIHDSEQYQSYQPSPKVELLRTVPWYSMNKITVMLKKHQIRDSYRKALFT